MRTTFYKLILGEDCLTHYTCQNGHKNVIDGNNTSMPHTEEGESRETIFDNVQALICPDCDDPVPASLKDRALKELKLMANDAIAGVILGGGALMLADMLVEPLSVEMKMALVVGLVGMVYSEKLTSELLTGAAIGQVATVIPMILGVKSTLCSALQLGLMATGAVIAGNLYRKGVFRLFLEYVADA